MLNQKEILDALTVHKDKNRFVSDAIDRGNEHAIKELVNAVQVWLNDQAVETEKQSDGTEKKVMGERSKRYTGKAQKRRQKQFNQAKAKY
ncbi:MAG: hypothetical protein JRE64_25840 [Deltaproteobacteria bacterium]|nr:hypothetical protein [Deltaproteobacteria bacterium]